MVHHFISLIYLFIYLIHFLYNIHDLQTSLKPFFGISFAEGNCGFTVSILDAFVVHCIRFSLQGIANFVVDNQGVAMNFRNRDNYSEIEHVWCDTVRDIIQLDKLRRNNKYICTICYIS